MEDLRDAYTSVFIEDSGTGKREPQNVPALVESYMGVPQGDEPMRAFNLRITDFDRARVRVLADVLGTSKSALARELLHQALNEAFQCLPADVKPDLDALDEAIASEQQATS